MSSYQYLITYVLDNHHEIVHLNLYWVSVRVFFFGVNVKVSVRVYNEIHVIKTLHSIQVSVYNSVLMLKLISMDQ